MSAVVNYCQCLFVGVRVVSNPSLVHCEGLFDSVHAEVSFLNDIKVGIEAVLLYVPAEDFYVLLDFR